MVDERESKDAPKRGAAGGGRAKPPNADDDPRGAERYPPVDRTDMVERAGRAGEPRSFDPAAAPLPRWSAPDGLPEATQQGRMGPAGDPAEGKP